MSDGSMNAPVANTDREIWREREGDYYSDSVFVTKNGSIGINCGGSVATMPVREWYACMRQAFPKPGLPDISPATPPPSAGTGELPFGVQKGEWTWRSYTDGDCKNQTVVMIGPQSRGGFQFLIHLDWSDYDSDPDCGRKDAEGVAKFLCAAVNAYRAAAPVPAPSTGTQVGLAEIQAAVARGWCGKLNEHKEMDADLANAIAGEVLTLFVPRSPSVEAAALPSPGIDEMRSAVIEECAKVAEGWPSLWGYPSGIAIAIAKQIRALKPTQAGEKG